MMRGVRGDTLRVAVGLFCLLLGALVLVAPHKLAGVAFDAAQSTAPLLGVLLISGGMMLVGTSLLGVSHLLFVAAHIVAAAPLVILGSRQLLTDNVDGALLAFATAGWSLVAA